MRSPLAFLALCFAGPAAAQTDPLANIRQQELLAQQQMIQQRSIAVENQLNALDARLRAEQSLADLRAQAAPPLPIPSDPALTPTPPAPAGGYASIPDDRLAASNARVRAASGNRR
jgi:hypothetical protein